MSPHPKAKAPEDAAARYLKRHGYKLIQRNFATPFGEIDIIAFDGMVVFVEVKSRASDAYGPPEDAVGPAKQRRLRRAAEAFLKRRGILDVPCRFDVLALTGTPERDDWAIEHFQDAF